MKKWALMALINRCGTFDFSIKGYVTPEDQEMTTLLSSADFVDKIEQKYYSFGYVTGSFPDPELGYVEMASNISEAVNLFKGAYALWRTDRLPGLLKLYQALRSKYDPIWNVDGVEIETISRELQREEEGAKTNTGTSTTADTGTSTKTNTGTGTTTETGTDAHANTGTTTTANTGTQATAKTGSDTVEEDTTTTAGTTTYDSATFYDKEKTVIDGETETTYNNTETRTDNLTELVTDATTTTETKNLTTQQTDNFSEGLTRNLQSQRTDNLTEATEGSGSETESTERRLERHGNIGVTKTQDLIMSQFEVTERDRLKEYIVNLFIVENCIVL